MSEFLTKENTVRVEYEGETAFPIRIEYENEQVCVVNRPEDIAYGVAFKVLQTQVKD